MEVQDEYRYGYEVHQESYRVYRIVKVKNGRVYWVWNNDNRYTCTCPVFEYSGIPCKHIQMVLRLEGKI